jgi:hypothetical protein
MARSSSMPSGGAADSALAWFRQNLATVLGAAPGAPDIFAGPLGTPGRSGREAVATMLSRRFSRSEDPATGRVLFRMVDDALLLPQDGDETSDPLLGEVVAGFLRPARSAIAGLDRSLCLPDMCPHELADACDQAVRTIDLIIAEAPRRGNGFQLALHLDELTERVLGPLQHRFPDRPAADIAERRARAALDLAVHAAEACRDALDSHFAEVEDGPAGVYQTIRRCAVHVPYHAQRVLEVLHAHGVGGCELDAYLVAPAGSGSRDLSNLLRGKSVTFKQLLEALRTQPDWWNATAENGRIERIDLVRESAAALLSLAETVKGKTVASRFQLGSSAGSDVAGTIDRAFGYIVGVLRAICGRPAAAPARSSKAQASKSAARMVETEPPPQDREPL